VTLTDIEIRLRTAMTELASTTPLANPDHPREGPTVRRSRRSMRLVVGTVAAAVAIAGFAVAIAYGPGSSVNGGSRTPTALIPAARHLAAAVEVRSGDLPGWPGYATPPPDPATTATFARCMGNQNPRLSAPVGTARSKQFSTKNLTEYVQSFTYVMATVGQAEQLTARDRRARFPSCYARQNSAAIAANLESSEHVVGQKVLGVGPAPRGVNQSDSLTVSTSYTTQQVGATELEHTVVRLMVVRVGKTVTNLVVSAQLTAGPFPAALFNRLAVTLSRRLASST
jgi:hypothetical protein